MSKQITGIGGKKNERKKQGHRQPYTKVKIEKISQRASTKKAAVAEEVAEVAEVAAVAEEVAEVAADAE